MWLRPCVLITIGFASGWPRSGRRTTRYHGSRIRSPKGTRRRPLPPYAPGKGLPLFFPHGAINLGPLDKLETDESSDHDRYVELADNGLAYGKAPRTNAQRMNVSVADRREGGEAEIHQGK